MFKSEFHLKEVAQACGIELSYTDIEGRRHEANPEVLQLILEAMGVKKTPAETQKIQVAYQLSPQEKSWGIFVPLYALYSERSWGAGDFSDLEKLIDWVHSLGGEMIGTLPLLSTFLEQPFSPSPYTPVSRLFWNEFFLNLESIPEFANCREAQRIFLSLEFQNELEALRSDRLVDYRRQWRLKRVLLEELSRYFFSTPTDRWGEFEKFVKGHPQVSDYARFRAVVDRQRSAWRTWPSRLQKGELMPGDFDEEKFRYHQFVQWILSHQIQALKEWAETKGVLLYLDFPLGVHPDGYDAWRYRDLFVEGVSVGAPPDPFFAQGQDWGFAPLHPAKLHEQGFSYLKDGFQNHLQYAGILRIDHVMGFHRQFWIPHGFKATDGVYVKYPADRFYNLLAELSQQHRAMIVGEDLGTVPAEVRPAMQRHGFYRSYVSVFEELDSSKKTSEIPRDAVASLNTHDMPPFAATADGSKLLSNLERLAKSPAALVMINLEDLWGEDQPQNVPGTTDEYPNWRRKGRMGLEEIYKNAEVCDILRKVDHWRSSPSP